MCGLKRESRCILAVYKALSGSEIEYAFFVSKGVGHYDQTVREAVDCAERYPSDPSIGREPQR